MRFTIKIVSSTITNKHYTIHLEKDHIVLINEDDIAININEIDLYKILDDYFRSKQ